MSDCGIVYVCTVGYNNFDLELLICTLETLDIVTSNTHYTGSLSTLLLLSDAILHPHRDPLVPLELRVPVVLLDLP